MKLVNISLFFLSMVMMFSCRTSGSDTYDVAITNDDGKVALLGTAFANDASEVICKFDCRPEILANPTKKRENCINPKYVLVSEATQLLEKIDFQRMKESKTIETKKLMSYEWSTVIDTFDKTENIGRAEAVCDPILDSTKSHAQMLFTYRQSSNPPSEDYTISEEQVRKKIKLIDNNENDTNFIDFNDYPHKTFFSDKQTNKKWYRSPSEDVKTFAAAKKECEDISKSLESDWQLPTVVELYTLYKHGYRNYITPVKSLSWSASLNSVNSSYRWVLDVYNGKLTQVLITSQQAKPLTVLCVERLR